MKTLRYTALLFAMVFAFGCTPHRVEVPEAPKKAQLTFEQFQDRWKVIVDKYIQELPNTPEARLACFQKLIAKGLEECLGDRNSHYLSKENAEHIFENLRSTFSGVGIELSDESPTTIKSIIEESPAEKSGKFQVGDAIVDVDGQDVSSKPVQFIVDKVRGDVGTQVTLRVKRKGKKLEPVILTRARVVKRTVYAVDIGKDITYLKIDHFSNPTPDELMREISQRLLVKLRGNTWIFNYDAKKFVIDLRGNGGGAVDAVGLMSYFFAESEDEVVLTTRSRNGEEVARAGMFIATGFGIPAGVFRDLQVVVIIDGGSASASEIFAEFLHQSMGVPLVGKKSYGKGSVQEIIAFEEGDALYITIAEYFVGNKAVAIDKIGIQPEHEVDGPAPEKEKSGKWVPDVVKDTQLKKAIELLRAKPRN